MAPSAPADGHGILALYISGKDYCGKCGLKILKATSITVRGIIKRNKLVIGKLVDGKICEKV